MIDPPKPTTGRTTDRRRVLKAGIVAYNDRHVTLPCGVRDMSATGARLIVSGSIAAPDTFELIIEMDGAEVHCEVMWRRGQEIGVAFASPILPSAKKREQVVSLWTATGQKPSLRRKPPLPTARTRS